MNDINKKAVRPQQHNSMYVMLIVSMAVFFIFVEMISSPQVIQAMNSIDYTLTIWMSALSVILAIFAFIYYRYLCIYIFEEKIKDYGILFSLGYSQKAIKNSFIWSLAESKIVALIWGLLAGSLVYYILLNIFYHTLNTAFNDIPLQGYVIVCAIYFAIYAINALLLCKKIDNMGILDMINYKKSEKNISNPVMFQNIGFALFVGGVLLLLLFKSGTVYGMASALLPMLCLTGSAYFLTLSFSHWFTKLFSNSKTKYLNNLFYISQLKTNYKKYAKLLTGCTIIVIFGLYLFVMDISFTASSKEHDFEMPFDFVVNGDKLDSDTVNNIQEFEASQSEQIKDSYLIQIVEGKIQWNSEEYNRSIYVIPERSYNRLTGKSLNMQKGKIIVLSQIDRRYYSVGTQVEDGIEWGYQPPTSVSFKIADKVYSGNIIKELWEIVYNIGNQDQRTYIISDADYDTIIKAQGYTQWKYFVSVLDSDYLPIIYEHLQKINLYNTIEVKALNIKAQSQNNLIVSILILLAVILLLFSLISLMMLRIKQNTHEEKKKYSNLYSIGFTYEKLKDEIKKEMATLFFLPLIIGSTMSVFYTIFSNVRANIQLIIFCISATLILFIIEYILYRVTTKALAKQYLK